jgi:sugar lactone lactonase YvrE
MPRLSDRDYKRRSRKYKKEEGLCDNCRKPATHGYFCIEHWRMAKVRNRKGARKQVAKRKVEGKCIRCVAPLDPDADAGFVKCINCREDVRKGSLITIPQRRYYDYITVEESSNASEL